MGYQRLNLVHWWIQNSCSMTKEWMKIKLDGFFTQAKLSTQGSCSMTKEWMKIKLDGFFTQAKLSTQGRYKIERSQLSKIQFSQSTLLCIQIVLFHSFEHFSYLNTLWSQHVRISDFLLYELARSSHQASQLQTYINKVDNTVTCQAYCKHNQLYWTASVPVTHTDATLWQ